MSRVCVKCGSDDTNVTWHGAGLDHFTRRWAQCRKYGRDSGPEQEHLCCCCRVCQYAWKEDTLDGLSVTNDEAADIIMAALCTQCGRNCHGFKHLDKICRYCANEDCA